MICVRYNLVDWYYMYRFNVNHHKISQPSANRYYHSLMNITPLSSGMNYSSSV